MRSRIINFLFLLLLALLIGYYSQKPVYNWDMIPYIGIVLEYSEPDISKVHTETYSILKAQVPADVYNSLTNDIEDRRNCLLDAKAFENELSYFRVKPLYTATVFVLYKCGISMFFATLLPSLLAAFCILLVVYYWLCMYLKKEFALVLTLLLGLYPPFRELAELSSPDAISNLFIILSLFLVASGNRGWMLIACIILSVLARVDNFIFAGIISYFVFMRGRNKGRILLLAAILAALGTVCILVIPMLLGDSPDWFLKFAYTASSGHYIQHWKDVFYLLRHSIFDLLIITVAVILLNRKSRPLPRYIATIVTLSVLFHMILFPSLQERFLVAYEFTLIIMLVKLLQEKYKTGAENESTNALARLPWA